MDSGRLQVEYEETLSMAEEARSRCHAPDGSLLVVLKDRRGRTFPNPYLAEYHRLMNQARHMARDLGVTEPEEANGELVDATESGDRVGQLRALLRKLAMEIEACDGHGMAALSGVYLETQRALEEAMADEPDGGVIDAIVARKANPDQKRFSIVS